MLRLFLLSGNSVLAKGVSTVGHWQKLLFTQGSSFKLRHGVCPYKGLRLQLFLLLKPKKNINNLFEMF